MSYHLVAPSSLADSIHPLYALSPMPQPQRPAVASPLPPVLGQEVPKPGMDPMVKKVMVGIAVVLVIAALVYWLDQQMKQGEAPVRKNRGAAKKMSTGELAKNLYSRLERRGGVSDTTMRSLRALSRKS
jgi:hypothetical protein